VTSLRQKLFLIAGLSTLIYLLIFSLPYPLSQHYNQDSRSITPSSAAIRRWLHLVPRRAGAGLRVIPVGAASGHASQQRGLRAVISLRFVLLTGALLAAVLLLRTRLVRSMCLYMHYTRGWACTD